MVPQASQNFEPVGFSDPQFVQRIKPLFLQRVDNIQHYAPLCADIH
jgi:hypothetical protein